MLSRMDKQGHSVMRDGFLRKNNCVNNGGRCLVCIVEWFGSDPNRSLARRGRVRRVCETGEKGVCGRPQFRPVDKAVPFAVSCHCREQLSGERIHDLGLQSLDFVFKQKRIEFFP